MDEQTMLQKRAEQFETDMVKCNVPDYMQLALLRYLMNGSKPGKFLTAVLTNDFMKAVSNADATNVNNLKSYMYFLYNYAPVLSYGSEERVKEWMESGGYNYKV